MFIVDGGAFQRSTDAGLNLIYGAMTGMAYDVVVIVVVTVIAVSFGERIVSRAIAILRRCAGIIGTAAKGRGEGLVLGLIEATVRTQVLRWLRRIGTNRR